MSAYGNPRPYPTPELERAALLGRLTVARTIIATTERDSTRENWRRIADELLDHLAAVDERAATSAMEPPCDTSRRTGGSHGATPAPRS